MGELWQFIEDHIHCILFILLLPTDGTLDDKMLIVPDGRDDFDGNVSDSQMSTTTITGPVLTKKWVIKTVMYKTILCQQLMMRNWEQLINKLPVEAISRPSQSWAHFSGTILQLYKNWSIYWEVKKLLKTFIILMAYSLHELV